MVTRDFKKGQVTVTPPLLLYCYTVNTRRKEENSNQYDFTKACTMVEKDNQKPKNDQLKDGLISQRKNMQKLEAFFTQMRQEKGMEGSSKVGLKEGLVYTMEKW